MTKLAIPSAPSEEETYTFTTTFKCWLCPAPSASDGVELPLPSAAQPLIDGIMHSMSSARQSEVKAWEEELEACEHTLILPQSPLPSISGANPTLATNCSQCSLNSNLWLCLTCGNLGCGRKQYGIKEGEAAGGNGHGLAHYEQTGHGVCVKLGTITPEGGAGKF